MNRRHHSDFRSFTNASKSCLREVNPTHTDALRSLLALGFQTLLMVSC